MWVAESNPGDPFARQFIALGSMPKNRHNLDFMDVWIVGKNIR